MKTTIDIPANMDSNYPGDPTIGCTGVSNPSNATMTSNSPIVFSGDGVNPINISSSSANPNIVIAGNFSQNPFTLGASFSSVSNGQYIADQFRFDTSGAGVVNSSQASDAPTFLQSGIVSTQSLRVTVATADASIGSTDLYVVSNLTEGSNFLPIAQKAFTASFWVRSPIAGIHCVSFQNSGADKSYVAEYTIAVANTWQLVKITVPASPSAGTWNYTTGLGLKMGFALAAGLTYQAPAGAWTSGNFLASANQVNVMGTIGNIFAVQFVKIEPGLSATAWVSENIAVVLEKCYRYVRKSYTSGVAPATNTALGTFQSSNSAAVAGAIDVGVRFGNEMRIAPSSVTLYSVAGTAGSVTQNDATEVAATVVDIGANGFRFTATNAGSKYGSAGHFVANANL